MTTDSLERAWLCGLCKAQHPVLSAVPPVDWDWGAPDKVDLILCEACAGSGKLRLPGRPLGRILTPGERLFCEVNRYEMGWDVDTQEPQLRHLCYPYSDDRGALCSTPHLWGHVDLPSVALRDRPCGASHRAWLTQANAWRVTCSACVFALEAAIQLSFTGTSWVDPTPGVEPAVPAEAPVAAIACTICTARRVREFGATPEGVSALAHQEVVFGSLEDEALSAGWQLVFFPHEPTHRGIGRWFCRPCQEAIVLKGMPTETNRGCPCMLVEPCHPQCTCRYPAMSRGCARCCRYGSLEQRTARAARLVEILAQHRQRLESQATHATPAVGDDAVYGRPPPKTEKGPS